MSSKKREQEYDANRRHYREIQSGFKFGFLSTVIPSGAAFIGMALYYAIRGLVLLAGAGMELGQRIVNSELGIDPAEASTPLGYSVPYGFMGYILLVTGLSLSSFIFKKKAFNKMLLPLFAVGALYGLTGMFAGFCSVGQGLYLLALGSYGTWAESYVLRLHRELDVLSLKEGYPDFIIALDEPKTMANTSGLTYKQSEFRKRQRKEEGYQKMSNDAEMDELTIDTQLPKGNRKIDNMM